MVGGRQLALAAVLAGGVIAAGAVTSGGAPVVAQEPATGSVSFMVFGDLAELAAYQELVAAFEADQPGVDVELIHIPSLVDYRQRLGADFAAGAPADIVLINYRRYAALAAIGLLEPLGPYLRESALIDETDFYREAIEPFRWRGELMCIPQNLSSLAVYYNKALFDAAGLPYPADDWTWDDFLATAKALTLDLDGDGRTDQYGLGTEATIFRVAPFIWQNGGELVDNPLDPRRLGVDTTPAREAIGWFVDLQVVHGVVPDLVAETAEPSEDRFLNGRTALFLNSRRGVPTYRTIEGFDWDVAALPRHKEAAGILHSDAYCMPASVADKDLVWSFIEFANGPVGQEIITSSGRTVPSLREVAESDAFLDPAAKPANSRVFLDTLPVIRPVPVLKGWVDIEELASEEIERAFYGLASVDEAIAEMIRRTSPFFAGEEA